MNRRSLTPWVSFLCVVVAVGMGVAVATPAFGATRPTVTSLSQHRGPYWGVTRVVVGGTNFENVKKVLFGGEAGFALHVLSSTKLTVLDPGHNYGTVHVRVVTPAGASAPSRANQFTFTHPTMRTPIMGGLTARQEQRISAQVRAAHRDARISRGAKHWTSAMGATAVRRAGSWLGLPYSWDGGDGGGPTFGMCVHNGGDLDCHVIGFDCSGLSLYSWAPYEHLFHHAATQHRHAGRFHPSIGQLMPGDLVFFSGHLPSSITHVAVYAGRGTVIQAAQSGTEVMRSRLADVIAESGRYRGATRPMSAGQQGHGPGVASVTPQVPVAGGYITITGHRLGSATTVSVDGAMLYSFAKRTTTRLVVKVPSHDAGRVPISVSNAWGTAHRMIDYVPASRTKSSRALSRSPIPSRAPQIGVEPTTARARNRFFEDRVGEYWYLVGRLLNERSHVRGCLDRSAARLTGCLERALR